MDTMKACKLFCAGFGIANVFACCFIASWAIVEKLRLDPFYTPLKCTNVPLVLRMSMVSWPPGNPFRIPAQNPPCTPGGTPPCGLHGHVATLSQTCQNPNEYDINSKTSDIVTVLYLPNLTNQIDGKPFVEVARSYATADVALKAKSTTMMKWSYNASLPLATIQAIAAKSYLQGYVPIYTHTTATRETCVRIFGSRFCNKDAKGAWCGTFGGHCVVAMPGTNLSEPALCAFTSSVCRESLADMQTQLTPLNVGLAIASTFPCPPATGLPAVMNCSVPSAPGIDALAGFPGKSRPIPGFVDGPHPSQNDIDDGKSKIVLATSLAIGLSVAFAVLWCVLSSCIVLRCLKVVGSDGASGAAFPGPNILTSASSAKAEV